MEAPTRNGGKVRFRWAFWIAARLERWNDNEELVAMVSIERRIHGSGVSLHRETQPEPIFRAGNYGYRKSELETNLVRRQS